jgi:hypothetical protein
LDLGLPDRNHQTAQGSDQAAMPGHSRPVNH